MRTTIRSRLDKRLESSHLGPPRRPAAVVRTCRFRGYSYAVNEQHDKEDDHDDDHESMPTPDAAGAGYVALSPSLDMRLYLDQREILSSGDTSTYRRRCSVTSISTNA